MDNKTLDPLREAVDIIGLKATAALCEVSYVAVLKWLTNGLPKTEWTGETNYCRLIEQATGGKVLRDAILSHHRNMLSDRRAELKAKRVAKKLQSVA